MFILEVIPALNACRVKILRLQCIQLVQIYTNYAFFCKLLIEKYSWVNINKLRINNNVKLQDIHIPRKKKSNKRKNRDNKHPPRLSLKKHTPGKSTPRTLRNTPILPHAPQQKTPRNYVCSTRSPTIISPAQYIIFLHEPDAKNHHNVATSCTSLPKNTRA